VAGNRSLGGRCAGRCLWRDRMGRERRSECNGDANDGVAILDVRIALPPQARSGSVAGGVHMTIEVQGDTLKVGGVKALDASNASDFRDQIRAAMSEALRNIEIDLSQAASLDSCGLSALISLHKTAGSRNGSLRVVNPAPRAQRTLELARMDRIIEIVRPPA
jgi:anti-sigma B factor antagonist